MLSINMRIFKIVLLLIALVTNVLCFPFAQEKKSTPAYSDETPTTTVKPTTQVVGDHYDQRQNGTENYRIHVDGVVFVVAPVEALLLAGADESNFPLFGQNELPGNFSKPKPEIEEPAKPVPSPKSSNRPGLRLANLIVPLLRRLRHE